MTEDQGRELHESVVSGEAWNDFDGAYDLACAGTRPARTSNRPSV